MKLNPPTPALLPNIPARRHSFEIRFTLSVKERPELPDFTALFEKVKRLVRKLELIEPRLAQSEWIVGNNLRKREKCYDIDKEPEKCLKYIEKRTMADFDFDGEVIIPVIQNGRKFADGVYIFGTLGCKPISDMPESNGRVDFGFGAPYNYDWKSGEHRDAFSFDQLVAVIEAFTAEFSVVFARVADNDYKSRYDENQDICPSYQVFEHREAGGWMVMVKKLLSPSDVPEAEDVITLANGKSLVVTTKEPFSSYNLEHVERARAVEIRLNELGLLPSFEENPILD